ncbi:MAG: peroxiredoxin [Thermoplasmatales archaeon]|nr:peroxiredoxin [Thermoplasmatales archaeon]
MEEKIPLIGERFPEMEVQTTQGKIKLPDFYKGKWFILFSHPADFTPVCTTEFVAFQLRYEKFKEMNTELIGLSIDQVFSHMKWIEWIKENIKINNKPVEIKFPIIADSSGEVAKRLGMISPFKGSNTVRAVFVVDNNGIVRTILYYPQELGRNMDEILRIVKGLQTIDRQKVALPANWPNNEIIGGDAIVPPPADENAVKERQKMAKEGKIKCFDWWLCHRKVEE